ncbi:MAG: translational GTPase TypA [Lentisphaeria bacterium]|nr:translational GTPase TypA [Lentisphaeria bacterium]
MNQENIRNVAIIAHVDHGKTTMVDELFRQSGLFRENQEVEERLMDSMDLERERGITIAAKNGAFEYKDHWVNIIDTPGHADFGGQVERVLQMADAAVLLVDAQEGPMPQTYFVLRKALGFGMKILVVVNKIDKPAARPDWVLDQIFDLFVKLNAPDHLLDFPVMYASARDGYAMEDPSDQGTDMQPILDMLIDEVPSPQGNPEAPLQLLVSTIDYSPFLGRMGIGKISNGELKLNQPVAVVDRDGKSINTRVTKLYKFTSNNKFEVNNATTGDIVAVAGLEGITIGATFTDQQNPMPMESAKVDPPTLAMHFVPNDSPFAGQEGDFVTSRHLETRLKEETLIDVALEVEELTEGVGYRVAGRGELHLSILIEKMRREGYEFQVSSPKVIFREEGSVRQEPWEQLTVDVEDEYSGTVIKKLGLRKGQMLDMVAEDGITRLQYKIPTRGLLGYKAEFMSDTKGLGVMNYVFDSYGEYAGDIRNRKNGVLISMETAKSAGYALFNLQSRGELFIGPGVDVYEGQIVGQNSREGDLTVNPAKGKKLTNVRASGSDESIILTPPKDLSLEDCIAFINDDELVEVTPKNIRLRKLYLKENDRKVMNKKMGW